MSSSQKTNPFQVTNRRRVAARWLLCGGFALVCLSPMRGADISAAPKPVVVAKQTAPPKQTGPPKQTFMVPMRDGVKLATDVYLPEGQSGPFPVVLMRNPYNKAGVHWDQGLQNGYAFVIQDTRGRFASEGEGLAFEGDGWADHWDGYDTLEWIAKQPWCNGKIGTMGGSALGITQLDEAGAGTTRLSAQRIEVGAPCLYQYALYPGGAFKKGMMEDWVTATKHSPKTITLWTSHPDYDAFWRARDVAQRWSRIDTPAVHIGGWYDIFSQATIDSFLGYQTQGGPKARGKQKLLMGPWTHGIYQDKAGELSYPNGKTPPDGVQDALRWFDYCLKGENNGMESAPAVTYYVLGASGEPGAPGNVWRTADRWPPFETTATPFYLHADHMLATAKRSSESSLTYAYDPNHPTPTLGGPQLQLPNGPREQQPIESRPDVLVFTGDVLAAPLEVTGRVRAHLWASSDAPDTDFVARLCDVYPDGRSFNVCEGILRARFRDGFTQEKRMRPGHVYRFVIDLWSTSIIFNKGHRLRVQITSSNAPGYEPNPNTGAPFRADSRTQTARNTILFDGGHASYILLPVAPNKN